MDFLYYMLTATLMLAVSPFLLLKALVFPSFRKDVKDRIKGTKTLLKLKESLWIHASSVGEVRLAKTLITVLQEQGETPYRFIHIHSHGVCNGKRRKPATCFQIAIRFPVVAEPGL